MIEPIIQNALAREDAIGAVAIVFLEGDGPKSITGTKPGGVFEFGNPPPDPIFLVQSNEEHQVNINRFGPWAIDAIITKGEDGELFRGYFRVVDAELKARVAELEAKVAEQAQEITHLESELEEAVNAE